MKHFNLKMLIALCCAASVYFVGCGLWDEGAECRKLKCSANGTCLDGLCNCEDGYEGEKCDVASVQKFVGHWKGQDTHWQNGVTDTIKIDWTAQTSTLPNDLKITNANGTVNILKLKTDKLTVQNEILLDSLHIIRSGTATINSTKTGINYQFYFKAIDTIPEFYSSGILIKQ